MGRIVVTIGRQFGSAGREIGKKLADQLGVAFYDNELLELAAKESGMSKDLFESNDEKPTSSLLYTLSATPYPMGTMTGTANIPLNQKLFVAQFQTIQNLATKKDCVIVGRCADYALRDLKGCINLFIHAPLSYRIARVKELYEVTTSQAKDRILKTDKKRAAYYNTYSDRRWGEMDAYHLALDSSILGADASVTLLKAFVEQAAASEG